VLRDVWLAAMLMPILWLVGMLVPFVLYVLSAPVRRVVRRDPREAEVALLTAVACAVLASGLMMPAIGDWP
jgi:hypothetical protein